MSATQRVGDILRLERRTVEIDPLTEYTLIGVYSFGKGIFHREPTPGAQLGSYRFFEVKAGDLVLSNIQAWEGAIAYAATEDEGRIGTHRFLTYISADRSQVDTNYLRYYFLSEPGFALIQRASPGSVTRNRTLSIERFEALEIPIPSIDEQRRIASFLDENLGILEVVAGRARAVETASLLAVFPALVDRVFTKHRAKSVRLGELVEVVTDSVKPGEDSSPAEAFIGLQHVETHTGRLLGFDDLGMEKAEKRRFSPGDIVYGTLRPNLNKVWLADRPGLCSVDQRVLRPRDGLSSQLIAHGMRSAPFFSQVMALVPGLQLPRIRLTKLLELKIQLVDAAEAAGTNDDIRASLARVTALVDLHRRRERLLAAVTPSLLNAAFDREH